MKTTYLILLASLTCIGTVLGVDPPPDGGYPNQNTAEGEDALLLGQNLSNNTAVGYHAIYSAQYGDDNTGIGTNALASLYDAFGNTAVGSQALSTDTYTSYNTAVGYQALNGITGFAHSDNTAVGYRAMANADSYACVAIGVDALAVNTGQLNTAVGKNAMLNNTTGQNNTAVGWSSMAHNTVGSNNAAVGLNAMSNNTSGSTNSVLGSYSAPYNTTGSNLVSIGFQSLYANTTGSNNTVVGTNAMAANISGSNNISLGWNAGSNLTTGDGNIDIGNPGVIGDAGVTRIGTDGTQIATYMAGIVNSPLAVATGIGITADGRLGVRGSSARLKEQIERMSRQSESIFNLCPVTFRYKKDLDPKSTPQCGLVAEDVAKINPELVLRDPAGEPLTVRYDEVNVMLLNEFLKEHKRVEAQGKEIAELKTALASQAELLQKINARFGAAASTARLVENR